MFHVKLFLLVIDVAEFSQNFLDSEFSPEQRILGASNAPSSLESAILARVSPNVHVSRRAA
jgi:hypothetical protein